MIKTLEKSFSFFSSFFHIIIIIIIYRFIEIYKRLIELIVNRVGITKVREKKKLCISCCSGVLFVQIVNSLNIRNSLVSHGRFIHIFYSCSVIVIEIFSVLFFLFVSHSRLSNAMHFY